MEEKDINVSLRLKEERKRLGFVQQDVADLCEVTKKTIGRWESGTAIPSDKLILLQSNGFDITFILLGSRSHLNFTGNSEESTLSPEESGLHTKWDQNFKEGSYDPTSEEKVGSNYETGRNFGSLSDFETLTPKNEINKEESARYREKDHENKERDPGSHSQSRMGSDIKDYSAGTGGAMEAFAHIPLFDVKASAGNGFVIHEEEETDALMFKKEWIYNELHSSPANLYLIYVEGESMEPALRPGDVILVDHTDNIAKRDGIYVIRMGESLLVKRLQRLPNNRLKVTSDNPAYEPFEISLDFDLQNELSIIGRVVWSGRRH